MYIHIYIYTLCIYTFYSNYPVFIYLLICLLMHLLVIYLYYESQPVGLAEVIDASEASLAGPGGRAGKMSANRVK